MNNLVGHLLKLTEKTSNFDLLLKSREKRGMFFALHEICI